MIILTLNSGSTSIKLAAYDFDIHRDSSSEPVPLGSEHHSGSGMEPRAVLRGFISKLRSAPDVIAHRVVHGGVRFTGPTRIDDSTEAEIKQLSELAPLHNPKAVEWIDAARAEGGD